MDLLCPDCAAEWSTLLAVAAHYTPAQLALTVHLFPLPYHTWAFSTAYAANAIAAVNASDAAKLAWTSYMFNGAPPPPPPPPPPPSLVAPREQLGAAASPSASTALASPPSSLIKQAVSWPFTTTRWRATRRTTSLRCWRRRRRR